MLNLHKAERLVAPVGALAHFAPPWAAGARVRAGAVAAGRGVWNFLKAIGEARPRRDMLALASSIAATRPELAARLHRAAQGSSWS